MREYEEISSMNNIKSAHELLKENSRAEQGAWKERTLDDLPMILAFTAHL